MADPDRYLTPHMVGGISVALGVVTPHSVRTRETQEPLSANVVGDMEGEND